MRSVILLLILLSPVSLFAQSVPGPWRPSGADTTYPRTLLHSSEIPRLLDSLQSGTNSSLLTEVYNDALQALSPNNTSIGERIARASLAKNAAFFYLLNIKPSGNTTVALSPSERDQFKNKAITILEQINTFVNQMSGDSVSNYIEWQWNSKEIIQFVCAYDLLKGGGASDAELVNAKNRLKTYVGNLYGEASKSFNSFGGNFFQIAKNNHAFMTAGAIGLSAVVLYDLTDTAANQKPLNWINAAMWNIHNVMWWDIRKQSVPGGNTGYAEGTYYFKYGFMNLLPFFRSMGYFLKDTSIEYKYSNIPRKIRNPWYDTNYDKVYDWFYSLRMPDGRMPSVEDSYTYRCFPELSVLGKSKYNWPLHLSQLTHAQNNAKNRQLMTVYDFRANYIAANIPEALVPDSLFKVMSDAGVAVWRSSYDSAATYFLLKGKHGVPLSSAEAHNHADDGSFMMMIKGQTMALSPGYLSYEMRDTVARAVSYNMLLVNGHATEPGVPGKSYGAETYIEKDFSSGINEFAELRTNYQNTDVNRKVMYIRKKYFLITDHMNSQTTPAEFSYLLHGYGLEGGNTQTGVFTDILSNKRAAWKRANSGLFAAVFSDKPLTMAKKTGVHEYIYQSIENHTYLEAKTAPAQEAVFTSCLQPYTNLGTDTIPVLSLQIPGTSSIALNEGGYKDVLIAQATNNALNLTGTQTGLSQSYQTNAKTIWASDFGASNADLFVQKATYLLINNDTVFTSPVPVNIQYVQTATKQFRGYCGDTGWIQFHTGEYPIRFSGKDIWFVNYNQTSKIASAYFYKPCYFDIELDDTRTGLTNEYSRKTMTMMPNPATNQTQLTFSDYIEAGSTVEVFDMSGKRFIQIPLDYRTLSMQMDVSGLGAGIYVLRVNGKNGAETNSLKLVINR